MAELTNNSADSNKQLIDMLRRSRLFRDYENVFTKATGLALTLRPLEFWQLAHHGKKNENPFCALLAEEPKTLAVCLQAHQDMIDHTGELPRTVTCPFGLTETAVPVKLGAKTIGYLRIGQVLRHTPAKSDTTKVSRELERLEKQFASPEAYRARLQQLELSPAAVRRLVEQQLYLTRYLDYKFRPTSQVDTPAIEKYYREQLVPSLAARGQAAPPLENVQDQIRELLIQREISQRAARWLEETRSRLRIELQLGEDAP